MDSARWQYVHLFNFGGRTIKINGSKYRKDRELIIREWISFVICIIVYSSIVYLDSLFKINTFILGLSYLAALICTNFIRYFILPKDINKHLVKIEKGE